MSNHLQNVLVTISDRKLAVDSDNDGIINYYNADVVTANDYYPFGSQMPGRKFSQANSSYRYGFNGKEQDIESTSTTTYDYGFRIYNPALGRFLSVDPLTKEYPWYTPYQFAGNSPIVNLDLDGLEEVHYMYLWFDGYKTKVVVESDRMRNVPTKGTVGKFFERVTTNVRNWWNKDEAVKGVVGFTDIDDATTVLFDKHVDGSDAELMDKAFAVVPIAGGKVVKQVLKKAEYLKYLKKSGYTSKVATAIVERGALRSSLKLATGALEAAHHIIPVKALKDSKVAQAAVDAGFDFNSATNGIPVLKSLHGSHPNYTTYVTEALEKWGKDKKYTGAEARKYIQNELIPALEKSIDKAVSENKTLQEAFKK